MHQRAARVGIHDARAVVIPAGHEAGSCRRADGRDKERLEPHALPGEPIQVRRPDLRIAVESQVAVALIVGHDQEDIGPGLGSRCPCRTHRRTPTTARTAATPTRPPTLIPATSPPHAARFQIRPSVSIRPRRIRPRDAFSERSSTWTLGIPDPSLSPHRNVGYPITEARDLDTQRSGALGRSPGLFPLRRPVGGNSPEKTCNAEAESFEPEAPASTFRRKSAMHSLALRARMASALVVGRRIPAVRLTFSARRSVERSTLALRTPHTNPKRKRGGKSADPSLTLRVSMNDIRLELCANQA